MMFRVEHLQKVAWLKQPYLLPSPQRLAYLVISGIVNYKHQRPRYDAQRTKPYTPTGATKADTTRWRDMRSLGILRSVEL